jgi:hypothetical protein
MLNIIRRNDSVCDLEGHGHGGELRVCGPPFAWKDGVMRRASSSCADDDRAAAAHLVVVKVMTSAMPTGLGYAPAIAIPAGWLMSARSIAPTSCAISANACQSGAQVYEVNPAMTIFGRSRRARSRIWS